MKILNRNQFKELIEADPGKRFAFYEYEPDVFLDRLHVTLGDKKMPAFGAATLVPNQTPKLLGHDTSIIFEYDWDLQADYSDDSMFAVLDEEDILKVIDLLKETIKEENNERTD